MCDHKRGIFDWASTEGRGHANYFQGYSLDPSTFQLLATPLVEGLSIIQYGNFTAICIPETDYKLHVK